MNTVNEPQHIVVTLPGVVTLKDASFDSQFALDTSMTLASQAERWRGVSFGEVTVLTRTYYPVMGRTITAVHPCDKDCYIRMLKRKFKNVDVIAASRAYSEFEHYIRNSAWNVRFVNKEVTEWTK